MNSKYLLALTVASSLSFVACEDLDTLPQGDTLTTIQKEEIAELLPERAEAGVTAVFAQFTQYAPNYTALGTFRHNDIGYPQLMMATEGNGYDVVMSSNGYNWA